MSTTPEILRLRKGLLANLPATLTPGAVSITTDEGAIYLDTADKRVRLSDIVWVDNIASYTEDKFENLFYYDKASNNLYRWDAASSEFVKITDLSAKVDIDQGTANANKILVTDANGKVTVVETIAADKITAFTGKENKVMITDASGKVTADGISVDDLNVLDGFAAKLADAENWIIGTDEDGVLNAYEHISLNQIKASEDGAADKGKVLVVNEAGEVSLGEADMSSKVNVDQGAANANKILITDADGKVTLIDDLTGAQVKVSADAANDKTKILVVDENGEIAVSTSKLADKQDANLGAGNADKVVITSSTGNITVSSDITVTELNTLNGIVTADEDGNALTIQNQIDLLKADIEEKLQAADAMTFKGTVSSLEELPTEGVEAGWTYKVAAAFTATVDGDLVQYAAGDLFIANADQGEDAVYAGGWSHVESGYVDDYATELAVDAAASTVTLQNSLDEHRGSITFAAGEGMAVEVKADATDASKATVTFGMAWDNF